MCCIVYLYEGSDAQVLFKRSYHCLNTTAYYFLQAF